MDFPRSYGNDEFYNRIRHVGKALFMFFVLRRDADALFVPFLQSEWGGFLSGRVAAYMAGSMRKHPTQNHTCLLR